MSSVSLQARAKINLSLDVTGLRDNGYHDVRMVMQNIDLYDEINIEGIDSGIEIVTDSMDIPVNEDNLIYKAARLMIDTYKIEAGVRVSLKKNIPVAAGMAGGSTDAAAVINGMNELFSLNIDKKELMDLSVAIGADVPYCILGGTALSEGIGEVLTSISAMPSCYILIGKPDISVSTKYVYTEFDKLNNVNHPDVDAMVAAINDNDLSAVSRLLGNVLEGVTQKEYPVIGEIKECMVNNGAMASLMSGSGPTVFGIFNSEDTAKKAKEALIARNIARDVVLTRPYNA